MGKAKRIVLIALFALLAAALALLIAARLGAFSGETLVFDVDGKETVLEVHRGDVIDASALEDAGSGMRFLAWLDENGEIADVTLPVERSARYTALTAPALAGSMTPWLEYDALGRIFPDEPVTGAELARGLAALFAQGAEFPDMVERDTVTASELAAALEGYFLPDELTGIEGDEPLTRLESARIIVSLGGFAAPAPESAPAPDLAADTPGAAELMLCADSEGMKSYTPGPAIIEGYFYYVDESGLFVTDAEVDGLYYGEDGRCASEDFEPGFVNISGYLYCVDSEGRFVLDAEAGGLYFGPDGRYTSGNTELDALVAEVLEPICAENETREDMLYAAYCYARDEFEYLRRNYYNIGATGWAADEAYTMFSTGRGNCYNYAAAFWALARGLGYDAIAVAGTLGWDYESHGWVDIYDEDGNRLTYDCETEMAYRRDGEYGKDMFAMPWWFAAGWNYYYGV